MSETAPQDPDVFREKCAPLGPTRVDLGLEVEGLDLCPEAVEVMRLRGLEAKQGSFWQLPPEPLGAPFKALSTSFYILLKHLSKHLSGASTIRC